MIDNVHNSNAFLILHRCNQNWTQECSSCQRKCNITWNEFTSEKKKKLIYQNATHINQYLYYFLSSHSELSLNEIWELLDISTTKWNTTIPLFLYIVTSINLWNIHRNCPEQWSLTHPERALKVWLRSRQFCYLQSINELLDTLVC